MSYRDDRDADRARIEALEDEVAAARRKIAELEGVCAGTLALYRRSTRRRAEALQRLFDAPVAEIEPRVTK